MPMSGEDCSTCLICHDALLISTVGALKCGHVYHRNCVVLWFAQGRAECPQCKMPNTIDDVRTLEFEVKTVPGLSPEELRKLEATTSEEMTAKTEELAAEKAEAEAVATRVDNELGLLREVALERKKARKEIEDERQLLQEDIAELEPSLSQWKANCAGLQAGLDAEAPRMQRKLPITQPREGDPDLQEERRKIRLGLRPGERARRLHDALSSARQQENEKQRDKNQRDAALKRDEDELRDLRHLEVQLRREYEERRSTEASQMSSQVSTLSASSTSLPSGQLAATQSPAALQRKASVVATPPAKQTPLLRAPTSEKVSIEVATPQGTANLLCGEEQEEDEDTTMLYGAARSSRSAANARPGLLGAAGRSGSTTPSASNGTAVKAGGGKWGALFGSSGAARPAVGITARVTAPMAATKTSMGSLFAYQNRV